MTETQTCRHCGGPLPDHAQGSYIVRRGFCSAKCNVAFVPVLRTVLCANTTCKRGELGTRKVFTTYQTKARCCSPACNATQHDRERAQRIKEAKAAKRLLEGNTPDPKLVDLPPEVIDAKLAALARRRRETRSWLRITDPWQQRAGSELHKSVTMDTYDINAGAML